MTTRKKPAFVPDGPSHPEYDRAREFALKWVANIARNWNPFDLDNSYKEGRFSSHGTRDPLHGCNDWPRRTTCNHDVIPEWCPLKPADRKNRLVIVRTFVPTRTRTTEWGHTIVDEAEARDCCFVFDPAELAGAAGLDPEHCALEQSERLQKQQQREDESRQRMQQWHDEREERALRYREAEAARQAECERLSKMQPSLF